MTQQSAQQIIEGQRQDWNRVAPGWEKWDSESKRGELNTIVGKRYIVQTTGSNIADNKVLQDLIAKTDLSKLAAMK